MAYADLYRDILNNPATSDWMRAAVEALEARDPVDAANDVEVLLALAMARLAALAPEADPDAFEDGPPSKCTGECRTVPEGKQWGYTNEDNPERGQCLCMFCGEDGDA